MAQTSLQLFELNQKTRSDWHNARKSKQESQVLQENVLPFTAPLVDSEALPPQLSKLPKPVKHGHTAYVFTIPADASGQAVQRIRTQPATAQHAQGQPPPAQVGSAVPKPTRLVPAPDTAAIAAPAAALDPAPVPAAETPLPRLPRTTAWRRKKAAKAAEAAQQGAIPKKRQ